MKFTEPNTGEEKWVNEAMGKPGVPCAACRWQEFKPMVDDPKADYCQNHQNRWAAESVNHRVPIEWNGPSNIIMHLDLVALDKSALNLDFIRTEAEKTVAYLKQKNKNPAITWGESIRAGRVRGQGN